MFGLGITAAEIKAKPCADVISRYEQLLVLSTPAGGRSKSHQKEAAAAAAKYKPFYDSCKQYGMTVPPVVQPVPGVTPIPAPGPGTDTAIPATAFPTTQPVESGAVLDMIDESGGVIYTAPQAFPQGPFPASAAASGEVGGLGDFLNLKTLLLVGVTGALIYVAGKKMSGQKVKIGRYSF